MTVERLCSWKRLQSNLSFPFVSVLLIQSGSAQVYVNPNDPIKKAPVSIVEEKVVVVKTAQPEYVTQTVYGFLDFTTTIGEVAHVK